MDGGFCLVFVFVVLVVFGCLLMRNMPLTADEALKKLRADGWALSEGVRVNPQLSLFFCRRVETDYDDNVTRYVLELFEYDQQTELRGRCIYALAFAPGGLRSGDLYQRAIYDISVTWFGTPS